MFESPTFWYLVSFLLFLALLGRPIIRVLLHTLNTKKSQIEADLKQAKELRDQAHKLLINAKFERESAIKIANEIMDRAHQEAFAAKEAARAEVEVFIKHQEEQLQERLKALKYESLKEVKDKIADLAVDTALQNLPNKITPEVDTSLQEQTLKKLTV